MQWVTARQAIATIAPLSSIVLGGGCGEPLSLTQALVDDAERLRGSTITSALHLGTFPFLAPQLSDAFHYRTWLATRALAQHSHVTVLPKTWREAAASVALDGPDVALVQVATP